mmetsp:Transcript_18504/g.38005  ORF Transcript_18504/g.38005 Transcript_18504/m.38005 type:complete len:206 (+) Transcript_18504:39-656(+)
MLRYIRVQVLVRHYHYYETCIRQRRKRTIVGAKQVLRVHPIGLHGLSGWAIPSCLGSIGKTMISCIPYYLKVVVMHRRSNSNARMLLFLSLHQYRVLLHRDTGEWCAILWLARFSGFVAQKHLPPGAGQARSLEIESGPRGVMSPFRQSLQPILRLYPRQSETISLGLQKSIDEDSSRQIQNLLGCQMSPPIGNRRNSQRSYRKW